ncbi:MAG: FAD-dependent oxidoreductase, partial [Bacilli bacterium]|nr:FAD-dependent oxidoreductase [Bacilli bacterium]
LEVPFYFQEVTSLKMENDSILVDTKNQKFECENLVLTLGRNPKRLEVENEQKLSGKGISWCAVCDGPLYKNKEVAVIGGGRSAIEESIYLSKMCSKVTLIHRREEFRAEKGLTDELRGVSNIKLLVPNQVSKFIEKEGRLHGLLLEDGSELRVDGCFEFIGQEPSTKICENLRILDSEGYIEVDKNYQTKYSNIYAGGDCIKKDLYQIVTACADGARIAEQILKK